LKAVVVKVANRQSGFTLIEMLVVIVILAIIAGLAVPALKNIGKSSVTVSAARQLLDDVGRARQLAMSQRTTVYMVFVPTNFWSGLSAAQQSDPAVTNLCDKQLSGYTFIANGAVGDQPGRHAWHYLAPWQNLPDGTFIAEQKFISSYAISGETYPINPFNYTTIIPFPTETDSPGVNLPYIAFNYLGQLVSGQDEYIPLAQGSVLPAIDPATRTFLLTGSPQVSEIPPGNSSGSSYSIIHIDALTGRAVLESQKIP
jgi:prepilin-type N-terminal cleavage/methylation domain-containing protein